MRGLKLRRIAAAGAVIGLAVGTTVARAPAMTVQSSSYEVVGTVVNPSAQVPPTVTGATGAFVIGSVSIHYGNVAPAEDSNGNLTIYVTPQTHFFKCDSSGNNCLASTQQEAVTQGASVQVDGRYDTASGQYELFASYVWSPPPAPAPPPPPPNVNPKPSSKNDYLLKDIFGVTGHTVETKTDKLGGWKMGNFIDYGCGSASDCQVKDIALAHNNRLQIDPQPNTNYWLSTDGGCTYQKTSNTYTVISAVGVSRGMFVSGRYTWDGFDWAFFAGNVFAPPPTSPTSCPAPPHGPVPASTSDLNEQNPTSPGTYDSTTSTWTDTQWQGTTLASAGPFGGGTITETLTWQEVAGGWEFWGTYTASSSNGQTGLSGEINGTASQPFGTSNGAAWAVNAQLTVSQGTGQFAGWQGSGYFTGTADSLSITSPLPPFTQRGSFTWNVNPT